MRVDYGVEHADFVFIDHFKERYLVDTKLLEVSNFIKAAEELSRKAFDGI